jgi:hypothetical protein
MHLGSREYISLSPPTTYREEHCWPVYFGSFLPWMTLSLEIAQLIEEKSFWGFCSLQHMQNIKMTSATMWRMELVAVTHCSDRQGRGSACMRSVTNSSQVKARQQWAQTGITSRDQDSFWSLKAGLELCRSELHNPLDTPPSCLFTKLKLVSYATILKNIVAWGFFFLTQLWKRNL